MIGFTRQEEAEKALWNEQRGRKFLGFTRAEQEELAATAVEGITIR